MAELHSGWHKEATYVSQVFRSRVVNIYKAIKWQRGLKGVRVKFKKCEFIVSGFELGGWRGYASTWIKGMHKDRRGK